jgi:hypothetical protein
VLHKKIRLSIADASEQWEIISGASSIVKRAMDGE